MFRLRGGDHKMVEMTWCQPLEEHRDRRVIGHVGGLDADLAPGSRERVAHGPQLRECSPCDGDVGASSGCLHRRRPTDPTATTDDQHVLSVEKPLLALHDAPPARAVFSLQIGCFQSQRQRLEPVDLGVLES
jgi:hypothetical protein